MPRRSSKDSKDKTNRTDSPESGDKGRKKSSRSSSSKKSHDSKTKKKTSDKNVIAQNDGRHRRTSSSTTVIHRPSTPSKEIKSPIENSSSPEYFSTPVSGRANHHGFESDSIKSPKRVRIEEYPPTKRENSGNETRKKDHLQENEGRLKDRRSSLKRENLSQTEKHCDGQQNSVESWIEKISTVDQTKYLIVSIFSALSLITFFLFSGRKSKAKKQSK